MLASLRQIEAELVQIVQYGTFANVYQIRAQLVEKIEIISGELVKLASVWATSGDVGLVAREFLGQYLEYLRNLNYQLGAEGLTNGFGAGGYNVVRFPYSKGPEGNFGVMPAFLYGY